MSNTHSTHLSRPYIRPAVFVVFLFACLYYYLPVTKLRDNNARHTDPDTSINEANSSALTARPWRTPPESASAPTPFPNTCSQRFGQDYIDAFGTTATNYCDTESTSRLTCFSNQIEGKRVDSLCVGGPVSFDSAQPSINLDCQRRDLTADEKARGVPELRQFPSYWYKTGPRYILSHFVNPARVPAPLPSAPDTTRKFLFLVKREANNENLWHEMMEIMSFYMSLDVLRQNVDPETGQPYFTDEDIATSRVLLLDELEDGPYLDLWFKYTGMPPLRLEDPTEDEASSLEGSRIVVPLAGSSNPFWQGDWVDIPCGESALLHQFSRRVLDAYRISTNSTPKQDRLLLTLIDRTEKRRLLNKKSYLDLLQKTYPDIDMQMIDYAALSFADQLRISSSTDILVGLHGAGLTHGMFLPPSSTIVEIQPPGLNHKGFDNMAQRLGHRYLLGHGGEREAEHTKVDWQEDDVYIEEDRFMEVMKEAIEDARRRDWKR